LCAFSASVRWLDYEVEETDPAVREQAAALERLVLRWIGLVQTRGIESTPGLLARALRELGPMPDTDRASARPMPGHYPTRHLNAPGLCV